MINTIKQAVEHLEFKFKNVWKPTPKDVEAYNKIVEFVEQKHKQQYQDYHLFAKLYVMVYAQFLEKYKATVFDDIPVKELNRYLDTPLAHIIQRFADKLNESELYEVLNKAGVENKHPVLKDEKQKNKETDQLAETIKNEDDFKKFTGQVWDFETVKQNLESQINNIINLNND